MSLENRLRVEQEIISHIKLFDLTGIEMRCDHLILPDNKEQYINMLNEMKDIVSDLKDDEGCSKTLSIRFIRLKFLNFF